MSESTATSLLVKIGADTSDLDSGLDNVFDIIKDGVASINPAVAGAIAVFGGLGAVALDVGTEFEEAYNTIIAKTGAAGEELESLKESFNDVFLAVPGDIQQTATALSTLHDKLGLTGDDLTNITEQVSKLAAVTGESASTIAGSVANAFQNWSVATDEQASKLDLLNTISQTTGISVTQLAGTLADVGNMARVSGESFDSTAVLIGNLSKNGIDAETIFQGINKAMSEAKANGVDPLLATLPNLILGIQNGAAASQQLQTAIDEFGKSGAKMYQLIADGKITLDGSNQSFQDSTNSINNNYAAVDTLSRELSTLKDTVMSLLSPLGEFVTGVGKDFIKFLNDGITGIEAFVEYVTGNQEALDKLTAAYDKANPVITTFGEQTVAQTTAMLAAGLGATGLSVNIDGLTGSYNTNKAANVDFAAALAAAKLNTQLLKQGVTDLDQAQSQSAANIKALSVPALTDLATAQNNLNIYRTEAVQSDQILQTAENALQSLIQSGTKDNAALALAESNVVLAKTASKVANDNLSGSEASLAQSKAADQQVTSLLASSQASYASTMASLVLPTIMSISDAEENVSAARLAESQAASNQLVAIQALSAFQSTTGVKDATEQAALELAVKNADVEVTATKTALNAAEQTLSLSRSTANQLTQDQTAEETALDSYLKSNSLSTYASLSDALDNLNEKKQAATQAAQAYEDAIQNETTVLNTNGVTQAQVADAVATTKAAKDALKNSTQDLTTAEGQANAQLGLSAQAMQLLGSNAIAVASNTALLGDAYNQLGIKSSASLLALAQVAENAYEGIAQSSSASDADILSAHIASLSAEQAADTASYTAMSASDQLLYAQLKQHQADFTAESVTNWSTMYSTIDKDGQTLANNLITNLFTGSGSFASIAETGLEKIGADVTEQFLKPITDGIASLIAHGLTDLLSSLTGVDDFVGKLGKDIAGALSTPVTTAATTAGTTATTGATTGASTAGSAASSAGDLFSTITSAVTAISTAITAITSVIGLFEAKDELDRLNQILNKVTGMCEYLGDDGASAIFYSCANLSNNFSNFLISFNGWVHDWAGESMDYMTATQPDIATIRAYSMLLGDIHDSVVSMATSIPDGLAALDAAMVAFKPIINVTVNNALDGTAIASLVTTQVEQDLQLAIK